MQEILIDQVPFKAADFLDGFSIQKKKSSNVDFFGFKGKTMFVQFHGTHACYLYELTTEAVAQAQEAESIGKFVANQVVGKFPSQQVEKNLVVPTQRETVVLRKDILSGKRQPYGRKNEEVYLVSDRDGVSIVESMKTGERYPTQSDNLLRKASK